VSSSNATRRQLQKPTHLLKPSNRTHLILVAMASILSSPAKPTTQSHLLDIPDDELQRGRKRRRSSGQTPPAQIPSTGSTTLRGRCRHRSLSQSLTFSPSKSSSSTIVPTDESPRAQSPRRRKSPRRKYLKKNLMVQEIKRRRSQSPSRSRSVDGGDGTPKPRRRQRTRSRSRSHGAERNGGEEDAEVAVED